jgi:hypothetical protein
MSPRKKKTAKDKKKKNLKDPPAVDLTLEKVSYPATSSDILITPIARKIRKNCG